MKRILWFGIVQFSIFLNDVAEFLLKYEFTEHDKSFLAIIWFLILIIPLFMFKDDKNYIPEVKDV